MIELLQTAIVPFLQFLLDFFKTWWWAFAPFLLWPHAKYFWGFWRGYRFELTVRRILFEIKFPPDNEKPIKAMESVFASWWQMFDPPNFREQWLDGEYQLGFGLEMVSTEGQVHFYLRLPEDSRRLIESGLYSQFPDAELVEVEDYTKAVPQNIPNKDWRLWGATYKMGRDDVYPLRTYPHFFEENQETKEEKRVDPMSSLIEALSKLGEGEHLWIQFMLGPFASEQSDFVERGEQEVNRLAHRETGTGKAATIPLSEDVRALGHMAVTGQDTERKFIGGEEADAGLLAPELRMTSGEREVVAAIEEKISKHAFNVVLRFVYLARTEKYQGITKTMPMLYFQQFNTADLNLLRPAQTTKVYTIKSFILDKRRAYLRRRRIFRLYTTRDGPNWPRDGGSFVMNVAELASMFHFPGRITFPSGLTPRVEAKKGEAPSGLPLDNE
jgi:hypothetical protein